ncbi:MAG: isoprenylcysteine carboxylmethyltransferase family protein [Planctomycetes bacterium]|nr:isoprenylcysteine carboxylmethyltransferase family protein [Planctomycetota bacterium]
MAEVYRRTRTALRVVQVIAGVTIPIAGFFWIAGRIDWLGGWFYVGVVVACHAVSALVLWRRNPELLWRRGSIGQGTRAWDAICLGGLGVTFLATVGLGALDAGRHGWSAMPAGLCLVGALLYAGFVVLLTWCMVVNPHFEKTVRIQLDRAHRVIQTGPYRLVRHPGYAGLLLGFILGTPLLLGSWWAFLPALGSLGMIAVRTALEDRLLRAELPGYREYAERVRYRLVPGVW